MQKMTKSISVLALVFMLICGSLSAQQRWGISASYNRVMPQGGLAERFLPLNSYRVGTILEIDDPLTVAINFENYHFKEINTSEMVYDDLKLDLQLWGLGSVFRYYPVAQPLWNFIDPYLAAGVGIYYWKHQIGEYTVLVDQTDLTIGRLVREEFTWAFEAQSGVDFQIFGRLHLDAGLIYKLIPISLWPTSRLHLEDVNGLHLLQAKVGCTYVF